MAVEARRGLRRVMCAFRVTEDALAQIDMVAGAEDLSRSDVLRRWVRKGLEEDYRKLFGTGTDHRR